MAWEPTIGKWDDEDNYVMMEPMWKKLWRMAEKHDGMDRLREVCRWFAEMNLWGDTLRNTMLIGSFLYIKGEGVALEECIGDYIFSEIVELTKGCNTIEECALNLLIHDKLHENGIAQFKDKFLQES